MLFIVNLLIKTDSTVICVPCILEHVCYEPLAVFILKTSSAPGELYADLLKLVS